MKYFAIFTVLVLSLYFDATLGNNWEPCGNEWEQYKDKKCFQIIESDHPTQSFESAIEKCTTLEDTATLVMIQSLEEQNFLSNFLFKIHKKVDNFWIGAKCTNVSNSFKWLDNSELSFTNWDSNNPSKRSQNTCVQMQADEGVVGKWKNEPCEKRNAVVCQKMPFWSIERLQKKFLNSRQEFSAALARIERDANKNIANLKQRLSAAENEVIILKNFNPVPIGFVYAQLSKQPKPNVLWPNTQWVDVTSEYAGLFFRAEGGNSSEFGTIQSENAPRITEVTHNYQLDDFKCGWCKTTLNVGGVSSGIGVYSGSHDGTGNHYTHKFFMSGGEIRPRNMAIRFWKRIN